MSDPGTPSSRFRLSLQPKILVFVSLCVAAPVVSMGIYLLRQNAAVLGERVRETLSNHLLREANELNEWMDQRLSEAQRWSTSFVVYEGVEALSRRGGNVARVRRDLNEYLEFVRGHFRVYESLFIVDLRGSVLAATQEEELEEWAAPALASLGLERGGVVSPLRVSARLSRPTLLVLQPIQGIPSGQAPLTRVVGYFVERVDLRKLEELLSPPAGEPAPSFWLLDEQGRILIRDGRVMERPGREAFPAFREGAWVGEAEIPGAGRTVCGLRPLTGRFRGYLAGLVPAATAYRPLEESRNRLLAYGVPAVLGILFLNLIAARSLLRPVLLLREGARRASAGDLDVYLPVRGRDEIAELTRAFNEMARRVREGRQSLEEARDELARINEDLKVANRTLETLAITDGLTGLYNHRPFQDTLEKEIRRCDRDGRQLGLLLLDLDHFKQYNDRWGHTEGDAALRRVAGHVLKSIRSTDMAFRYGGEELAVLLPSCTKKQAADVAEKIRMAVGRPQGRPVRFGGRTTVSIGVATFPEDGRVVRGLVDAADAALYQAKERGRNRVVAAGADSAKTETVG